MADAPDPFATLYNTATAPTQPVATPDAGDPFGSLYHTADAARASSPAPPGSLAVPKPPAPGLLSRLGDFLGSTHEVPAVAGTERAIANIPSHIADSFLPSVNLNTSATDIAAGLARKNTAALGTNASPTESALAIENAVRNVNKPGSAGPFDPFAAANAARQIDAVKQNPLTRLGDLIAQAQAHAGEAGQPSLTDAPQNTSMGNVLSALQMPSHDLDWMTDPRYSGLRAGEAALGSLSHLAGLIPYGSDHSLGSDAWMRAEDPEVAGLTDLAGQIALTSAVPSIGLGERFAGIGKALEAGGVKGAVTKGLVNTVDRLPGGAVGFGAPSAVQTYEAVRNADGGTKEAAEDALAQGALGTLMGSAPLSSELGATNKFVKAAARGTTAGAGVLGLNEVAQGVNHALAPDVMPSLDQGGGNSPYMAGGIALMAALLGHGAHGEAAKARAPDNAKGAPVATDTAPIEAALHAAGFTPEQIAALKESGGLDQVAKAATPAPKPALEGPAQDAPLPANATRALPSPEAKPEPLLQLPAPARQLPPPSIAVDSEGRATTNAQALDAARAADAAAQERQNLGLTPDVERAQQARQEGVKAAEAEALQRGAPGESPRPEDRPAAGAQPEPELARAIYSHLPEEIGWDQEGGHIVRGAGGGAATGGEAVAGGNVTGRTSWIAKPSLAEEGESTFWRNRPTNAKLSQAAAAEAFRKEAAGERLKPIEQRFIDYAHQHAEDVAQTHADETARQQAIQRNMDDEALAAQRSAWRDDGLNIRPQDEADALTFQQWTERAHNAGASGLEVAHAIGNGTLADAVPRLAQLVSEKERSHGADAGTNARDRDAGIRAGGTGRTVSDAEAGAGVSEPQGPRGDLFPAPSHAEQLRAASATKDAERNGLNRREPTPAFTGTDLGAAPHGEAPEQARIPEGAEPLRFATQKEAGMHAATLHGDARVRRVTGDDGKPAWEVTHTESQRALSSEERAPQPIDEVSEHELSPEDQALVQRTRARAKEPEGENLSQYMRRQSAERGEQDANDLGLRGPVAEALGPERVSRVHFVHDEEGLPLEVQMRSTPIKRGNVRYGLHTRDGDTYLFTKAANTPERAVWTALHEVGGHEGFAKLAADHPDVKVGTVTVKEAHQKAREMALQNPTVAKLAEVIAKQRGSADRPRMAEEAMAELQAAARTGRWDEIARKYGVDVPKGVRQGVQGAIANFVRRLKAILNAIHAKITGKATNPFTDADVHDMLNSMWEAARGEHAGEGEHLASDEPAQTDTPAFERWFGDSKVVDANGKPLAVYHGATRPDRIGNRFRKTRATSGPMAFFTDDPSIASNYAKGKPDTSLEPPADYAEWFKYKVRGSRSEVPIDRAWYHLTPDARAEITDKLPHVSSMDTEGNDAPLHLGGPDDYGLAGKAHWDYEIKKARGNVLEAAKEVWLNSGALFNDEPEFMNILRLGGMDMGRTRFDDPGAQSPAVFKTFLSIKDPLDTSHVPPSVLDALEKRARRQPAPKEYGADTWAKQTRDARDWIQQLREDIATGSNSTVWTSIPDWVSRTLKEFGYDGIKDTGGKNGGDGHTVWIPFDDRQVKSATGNRGTFDPNSPRIDYSEEPQDRADTMGRGASGPAVEPETKAELPPRAPGESQPAYHARIMRENREPMRNGIMRAVGLEPKNEEAKAMRDIGRGGLRAMWAASQRAGDRAAAAFKQAMAVFDKSGKDANLRAIDQWENGQEVTSAPHRLFFKAMDNAFNDRVEAIRRVAPGAMESVIEHYFPHLWEDPTKAAKWYQQMAAKRPLEGSKAFLKQRVHATIADGIASGLKPISTNPVDLVLAKMAQMDKFIALHQFRQDLQARGWLKEMDAGERVPYGYARIDDPAFVKAAGLQGYFAVPELIARDVNNYLGPSLSRFKGFRALRKVENLIMMARLGWSAFHAGFTTLDNMVMHADVGLRYMLQGDIKRSLVTLAKTPLSVAYSPVEGGKLNRQWLGLDKADVHTAALLDALEQGGARWKMSSSDYNNDLPKFIRSLRQRDYGTSVKTSLSAAGEVGSWLIHHKLVPNQKMAARLLLAKFALDKFAKPLGKERGDYAGIIEAMHPDALKQIMGDVVNNVDDRLGQMNYDNQFWNKTARELAQTAIGAVGWQVGTVRTVTGGLRDVERLWNPKALLSPLDKGGKITDANMGRISGRLTYLVSLALLSGGSSAALQYMLTGQGPSEIKDYFFPKTGRKNADGSDERLQFPSYWMDHYKLATHPLQTAEHKLHPILSMFMEAISNQDYYGVEIRDPHASWLKQAEEVGEYVAKGFLPYSWTNNRKAASNEAGIGRQAASFVGVTTAPASVSRSKFQAFVAHNGNKGFGHEKRTAADAEHSQTIHDIEQQMRNGGQPDLSGLSRRDLMRVQRESREQVPQIQFKKMAIEDKLDAWDMATPQERKEYHLRNLILNSHGTQTDRFRRLPADERRAIVTRIREISENSR